MYIIGHATRLLYQCYPIIVSSFMPRPTKPPVLTLTPLNINNNDKTCAEHRFFRTTGVHTMGRRYPYATHSLLSSPALQYVGLVYTLADPGVHDRETTTAVIRSTFFSAW